jgi:hypothetical protein
MWDPLQLDVFEGSAKHHWVDMQRGWCHLCQEPVGTNLGVHLSERDHVCLGVFMFMIAHYPRTWGTAQVVRDGLRRFPGVSGNAVAAPWCQDHLHTSSDEVRRAELHAILVELTGPPHCALQHALQSRAPMNLWVSGERMYKIVLSRLVTVMLPPMAPGVHSQFTHKCWGRSNLERMYEGLRIADIKRGFGVEPKTNKDGRAYWMRLLFWELMTALDNRPRGDATAVLLEEALRRLAFELTHHMSMYYMNRAYDVWVKAGRPSPQRLHELGAL